MHVEPRFYNGDCYEGRVVTFYITLILFVSYQSMDINYDVIWVIISFLQGFMFDSPRIPPTLRN